MTLTPKIDIPRSFGQIRVGLTPRAAHEVSENAHKGRENDIAPAIMTRLTSNVTGAKNKGVKLS